jgi:hypothetical protein
MTMGARKTVPPLEYAVSHAPLAAQVCAVQVVSDGAVGRQPHLLELELLDALLVGGDGRAFYTDRVFLDSLGGIECHLIVGLVTVWQAEVVVLEVDVEIWVDELVFDDLPDDAGHLIAVKLHDGVLDLDLLDSLCRRHPVLSNLCV